MAAGPSGLHKNVPPGTFLTPLDEFLCCYRAGPECLINILEFLDFDDEGNNRNLHIPEEETKCSPLYKQVWPVKGFCMKTFNGKGGLVFINICHSEDIACPSDDILDTLLNMTTEKFQTVDLPVSLGKSHRERDEYGNVCLAFDVVLNTDFYEKQIVRYELLKAYVLVMIMRGLNKKYHLELQMALVSQVTKQTYWGKMPQHFIDRKKSAFYVDQALARIFYAARARRALRWAKKFAVKRLRKQPGRSSNCFRIRPIHPPRSRTTPCRECIRRNLVNPEEVIEEDSEDDEGSEVEVEEGSKDGSEEGSEIEGGSEKDGSEEESSDDDDSGEESCEVEKDSDVQETSEEDDSSEWGEGFEEEEGSEREEDFEDEEGSAEQGFEEEEGSAEQGFEEETGSEEDYSYEEDEGSDGEGFEYGCYEEAEGNSSEDIEVDSQGKVDESFEEERSSVEEDSGEEGDVEEGSDEENYSEDEEDSEESEASVENSEESEASEEDTEEEEIGNDEEDPEKEEDSEERRNLEKEIERDLKEEVENVLMKGVDKVPIHKELKEEVEKEIREEVEKYLREEVKKYFEIEVLKNSYAEAVQDPYKKEKEDYGMKVIDPSEAAVPPYNSITEFPSPTPGCEASAAMQTDLPIMRDEDPEPPLKVEYVDFKNGIYRIGFILEDEHFSSPSVVSPGDWRESVLLLNSIVPKENSLNLDYELFEILEDEQLQYVAILDLPAGTKVEGMGVFASADGVVLCNENGMRFCEMPLEYAIIPTQIKVMVNRLKVTMAIPFTEEAMRYRMAEEEVPDMLDYLRVRSR